SPRPCSRRCSSRCSRGSSSPSAQPMRTTRRPAQAVRAREQGVVMRVLVTWGSERGGTEGIAQMLADALQRDGLEAAALAPAAIDTLDGFDAVIVGGALHANRWHRVARRFVRYFGPRGARDPLPAGMWFAAGAALLAAWTTGGLM